jgi:hypothetical protein
LTIRAEYAKNCALSAQPSEKHSRTVSLSKVFLSVSFTNRDDLSETVERAMARAVEVYDTLSETMAAAIRKLSAGEAAPPLSPEEIEALRAHQRAILMVLDYEAQLLKRRPGDAAGAGGAFDIEAARLEVARRLDSLAAARDP